MSDNKDLFRQAVIPCKEGHFYMYYPENLTMADIVDLTDFFDVWLKQQRRLAYERSKADAAEPKEAEGG